MNYCIYSWILRAINTINRWSCNKIRVYKGFFYNYSGTIKRWQVLYGALDKKYSYVLNRGNEKDREGESER